MKKQLYEQPTTKTLVVRFGGMICQSPGYSPNGLQKGNIINGGGSFDEWDD